MTPVARLHPPTTQAAAPRIVIVIPAFNEAATVGLVVEEALRHAGENATAVVVDDGSADDTAANATRSGAMVVRHGSNRGLGASFRTGLDAALREGADIIVGMDADGQFDPRDIPRLVDPILRGEADLVTGTRFHPSSHNAAVKGLKRFGNRMFTRMTNRLTGLGLTDAQCGFRAYSRAAALRITTFGRYTYTQEVLLDVVNKGMRVHEVPIRITARADGQSRLVRSVWSYGLQALPLMLRSSRDHAPLAFFARLAIVPGLLGLAGFLLVGVNWLRTGFTYPFRNVVPLAGILVLLAAMLLAIGILGDMMDRQRRMQEEILYRLRCQEYGTERR